MKSVVVAFLPLFLLACPSAPPPPPPGGGGGSTCNVEGLDIAKPAVDDVAQRKDGQPVALGCIGNPEVLSQSATARLQGCIQVFGTGGAAKPGIKVAVFADDQDARNDTPAFGEVTIGVQQEASSLDCQGADADSAACLSLGCEKKGAYVIEDVPLHVPLTIKVYHPTDNTIIDTYTFGTVLDYGGDATFDPATNTATYEANLIYDSTYESIPTLAGRIIQGREVIGDGVGRGVIAGEIHDCDDVIIQGASVTSDQLDAQTKVTYFNGDDSNPLPLLDRTTTNTDGLYVIINATTDPGHDIHTIGAGILDPTCAGSADCQCVGLSSRTVHVYPDSVSIVTLRGDLPVIQ